MRLGPIQNDIIQFLIRCGGGPAYIGPICRAEEFQGLVWEQVERSLNSLIQRRIIEKKGIGYQLVKQ